jgi:hypothetical protein
VLQVHQAGQAVNHSTCVEAKDAAKQLQTRQLGAPADQAWLEVVCTFQVNTSQVNNTIVQRELQKVWAWQLT